MPKIKVVDFNGTHIDQCEFEAGTTFSDAAMEKWPEGFQGHTLIIHDDEGDVVGEEAAIARPIPEGEEWSIVLMPQGPTIFLGLTYTQWAIMAASLVVSYLTMPKVPNVQSTSYEWEDSNRPQFFSGQQNQVQPGRRIPDVFGTIRVYPDLMSVPAIEYSGNNQTIQELYVVSRGKVNVSQPKFHDESYDDVPGTSYKVYHPGEKWPSDFPIMRTNAAVGNVELPAENESINFGFSYVLSGNGYIYVEEDGYWDEFFDVVGAAFTMTGVNIQNRTPRNVTGISPNGRYLYVSPSFAKNQTISAGNINFIAINYMSQTNQGIPREYDINWERRFPSGDWDPFEVGVWQSDVSAIAPYEYNGTLMSKNTWIDVKSNLDPDEYKFNGGSGLNPQPADGIYYYVQMGDSSINYNPDLPGSGYASAIFNVPGLSQQAWMDFEFATGLYQQVSGQPPQPRSVRLRVWYRKQSSTGAFSSVDVTFSDKTRSPRRFTRKINFPTPDRWEVYVERVTPMVLESNTKLVVDAVRWIGLSGKQYTPELNDDTLNCTLISVTLRSQSLAQAGQNRRFNLMAIRNMYSYPDGRWKNTQKISDAILHTLYDMGNIPRANVDEASLLAIQLELEQQGPNDGKFNAMINQTMTTEDQAQLIASAGRIIMYRRGATFYFARLKAGLLPSTIINARNKMEPETRPFNFSELNDPDALILRYQNEQDQFNEATYQYPEGISPKNPQEQSILGITNPLTISKMAKYLWNKKVYEKDTVSVKIMDEGILLSPGDIISVTDSLTENAPLEGEIVNIADTTFTFDQEILAGTYMARVRDEFGELFYQGQLTFSTSSTTKNIPAWAGLAQNQSNIPTTGLLYSFTEIQYEGRDEYYVIGITPEREGGVTLDGVLYRDETYSGDATTSFQKTAKRLYSFDSKSSSGKFSTQSEEKMLLSGGVLGDNND